MCILLSQQNMLWIQFYGRKCLLRNHKYYTAFGSTKITDFRTMEIMKIEYIGLRHQTIFGVYLHLYVKQNTR